MVVRMRHTKSHSANRRSHHALKAKNLIKCSNCKAPAMPHNLCSSCGFYKGKKVLDLIKKIEKKQKKAKASKK
jgi:large subunit ribosomal protein L32